MYRIPESFDVSVLKNEIICQIAFGKNFFTLFFNKGFIQNTSRFSFNYSGKPNNYEEVYPVENDFGLLRILERMITHISLNETRDQLEIEFDDGSTLSLIGNEMYESFTIEVNGEALRV